MTTTNYGTDPLKQDSAFFTYSAGTEVVWEDVACDYYVVRAGEMRIHAVSDSGDEVVIRYSDQLQDFGIKTDAELAEWSAKPEEVFSWVNNSWFEVYTEKDTDFFSEPFHSLDEAIAYAVSLDKEEN
jgi:CRP-like cAMP-binding protein